MKFLIGLILGSSLAFGVSNGPKISGESGTLDYSVVIDGERVCSSPWVSIPDKVIECDRVK